MLQEQDYSKNLIDLIKNDDTDSVLELIKTSIDIKDMYLDTALQSATEMGNVSIINALIEAGANVESIDEYGQRPIHIAAASGNLDVLSLILNYAYIDSREGNGIGSRGNTALHYAAAEDSPNLTQLLINTGATINIKNNFQETPLHIAVMNNSLRNVINLLKYADDNLIYEENITGSTAIDIATNKDILNLLNRYVKSLSIGVMSSSMMNPDVVGVIGGASAVYANQARDEYFGLSDEKELKVRQLNSIVNNNIFRLTVPYPNLASIVLSQWQRRICKDWYELYGIKPCGLETFVIQERLWDGRQRDGACYRAAGWDGPVGISKGYSNKNVRKRKIANKYQGSRKLIYCKRIKGVELNTAEYETAWGNATKQAQLEKKRKEMFADPLDLLIETIRN